MSRHLTPQTLVHIAGLSQVPSAPQDSVLLMIDGQREYTSGRLPLVGIDAAVEEGARLLALARSAGMPVFHAVHHGRPGAALFEPSGDSGNNTARRPAVVYIHGGGPRQMLLGWHYRWEYANDYGANQYLVSRGFVVLSVDYRLNVGYGEAFQFAENTKTSGATTPGAANSARACAA